jgi:pre-mRNA-splicing factor 38B
MKLMLDHVDSPYIRCTGFLYLRYAADPSIIYKWFQPYLYDNEPVKIRASMSCKEITVGDFVRDLLNDLNYYTTRLPRLPIAIEREIKVKLLEEQQYEERAQRHLKDKMVMEHFERVGSKVQAMYGDEENEVTWYDAVVDRVVRKDDDTGIDLFIPKFMVTFPEYENTEVVTLGAMDMPGVDHSIPTQPRAVGRDATYSSGGGGGGRRDDRSRNGDQTRGYDYDRRRNDSDRGRGRNDERYSRRVDDRDVRRGHGSTQSSYSSRGYDNRDRDTHNRRDRSRSRDQALPGRSAGNDRSDSGPNRGSNDHSAGRHGDSRGGDNHADASAARSPPRKTRQELAVVADKKRKLLAKYG